MEVILLQHEAKDRNLTITSFNPCFYGSYSFTGVDIDPEASENFSFNPCFYGSYSFTGG